MVGIRGAPTFNLESGKTYALSPGDFLFHRSGTLHWGRCEAGEECVFYAFNDAPYDIHIIE